MDSLEIIAVAAGVLLIMFQVWLTSAVWRNQAYDREQKVGQTKLIWLVPLVGAVLVSIVFAEVRSEERKPTTGRGRDG